jgi:hypothetical protein
MNAVFAYERKQRLEQEITQRGKVWYHSGVRATIPDTPEWRADQWVKSSFNLKVVDAQEAGGIQIVFYEMRLPEPVLNGR